MDSLIKIIKELTLINNLTLLPFDLLKNVEKVFIDEIYHNLEISHYVLFINREHRLEYIKRFNKIDMILSIVEWPIFHSVINCKKVLYPLNNKYLNIIKKIIFETKQLNNKAEKGQIIKLINCDIMINDVIIILKDYTSISITIDKKPYIFEIIYYKKSFKHMFFKISKNYFIIQKEEFSLTY